MDREIQRLRMKADQEWDMAGLARRDGDRADEIRHTEKAREYERLIGELMRSCGKGRS
jgi:hypothetical protein